MVKAVFFDLSGVLYIDKQVIPGALDTLERLQQTGMPLRFITNTSRRSRAMVLDDLREMGFSIHPDQLFTATVALQQYLKAQGYRAYCINHVNIDSELAPYLGEEPDVVVVADAADRFDYAHLNRAFQYLLKGAKLIAIGENRYFKSGEQMLLDAGPFIRALEYAADTRARVIGKPAKTFFQLVVDSVGVEPRDVLMIGDDVFGDVEGALNAGLKACLVKTGKYRPGDENRISLDGALLAENVGEAVDKFVLAQ